MEDCMRDKVPETLFHGGAAARDQVGVELAVTTLVALRNSEQPSAAPGFSLGLIYEAEVLSFAHIRMVASVDVAPGSASCVPVQSRSQSRSRSQAF